MPAELFDSSNGNKPPIPSSSLPTPHWLDFWVILSGVASSGC
jgi:hypothetical protein